MLPENLKLLYESFTFFVLVDIERCVKCWFVSELKFDPENKPDENIFEWSCCLDGFDGSFNEEKMFVVWIVDGGFGWMFWVKLSTGKLLENNSGFSLK